jgi:hypothetical protein
LIIKAQGSGTRDDPWVLKTPPGTSEYQMYRDEAADPPQLVCQVGSTRLTYHLRAIDDLHTWLREQGDWVPLGAADEQKPAAEGTVEAFGRSPDNPAGGWYGLRKGTEADSGCTCLRCSRRSGWPSWSTTLATTGCAPCNGAPPATAHAFADRASNVQVQTDSASAWA